MRVSLLSSSLSAFQSIYQIDRREEKRREEKRSVMELAMGCNPAPAMALSGFDKVVSSPPASSASFLPMDAPKFKWLPLCAAGKSPDFMPFFESSGHPWGLDADHEQETKALVPIHKDNDNSSTVSSTSFETLSEDMAMGLVLRAASGTGWTTGSGLEGPSNAFELNRQQFSNESAGERWPSLSKSPRRRMRVVFTCNVCGVRTTRAINPHAFTDGTVFVQCGGCNIFHKLVDNLKLFHELKGSIFPSYGVRYGEANFSEHQSYDILGLDD